MPPEKKVLWLWKSYGPHVGREQNFFIITSSSLSAIYVKHENVAFRPDVVAENPLRDPVWSRARSGVPGCLKCTCTGRWVTGSVALVHRLLHHVLDARQRLLYRHWGLWATSLLGELQDGHVAQGTHLPHLQPLNEAPVRKKDNERRDFKILWSLLVKPKYLKAIPTLKDAIKKLNCNESYDNFQMKFDGLEIATPLYDSVHKRAVLVCLIHLWRTFSRISNTDAGIGRVAHTWMTWTYIT